ncbi:MAG: prephenate dehydrogenase [Solirubrobacterales bacterium]|nr:prephenate dehydrogenase [Solirubrobacterales bacterium]
MTSTRVAVVGTGLVGTSIAMAAVRAGDLATGWDADPAAAARAAERGGFTAAPTLLEAVRAADLVIVATPIATLAEMAAQTLEAAPGAVVTDAGSVKGPVVAEVARLAPRHVARFVGGHPMGGSERSGPDHASASVVDDIVWVLTPGPGTDPAAVDRLEGWVRSIGARPVRMDAARHDRLVGFVSHLPQVAATALMGLVADEEADEPEILLLAAGGFRDLTRLAASNPGLWSEILLSNREAIVAAIDLYVARLTGLRDLIGGARAEEVRAAFAAAKAARLTLAAKPQVRSGVAVIQVPIPDRPGALAQLTAALGESGVNIEDLQIVHSHEGGRGTVHLTVAATAADVAATTLAASDFDPTRLA